MSQDIWDKFITLASIFNFFDSFSQFPVRSKLQRERARYHSLHAPSFIRRFIDSSTFIQYAPLINNQIQYKIRKLTRW